MSGAGVVPLADYPESRAVIARLGGARTERIGVQVDQPHLHVLEGNRLQVAGMQVALAAIPAGLDVDPDDRVAALNAYGVNRAARVAEDRHEAEAQVGGHFDGLASGNDHLAIDWRRRDWTLSETGRARQETKCQQNVTHEDNYCKPRTGPVNATPLC